MFIHPLETINGSTNKQQQLHTYQRLFFGKFPLARNMFNRRFTLH